MKKIEIFGPGCPKCAALYELTHLLLTEKNSLVPVEKVTDAMEMGDRSILSVPALAIDGKVVFSGRVPSKGELYNLLLENGLESSCDCSCNGDVSHKDCSCGDSCDCDKKSCDCGGNPTSKDCSCGDACDCKKDDCHCNGDAVHKDCSCGDSCSCKHEKPKGSSCGGGCCCGSGAGVVKKVIMIIIAALIAFSLYQLIVKGGCCGSSCNSPVLQAPSE